MPFRLPTAAVLPVRPLSGPAYDTMSKAIELLPSDSEYLESAKTSLNAFRSRFPTSEECFFNELQAGSRYTVTCGTAAGVVTSVRPR